MIPYQIYKIIHLLGVFMVVLALGGLATHAINGGGKEHPWRKGIAITHGVGLLISLIGGFGALARLGLAHDSLPGWIYAKLVIWLYFGALMALLIRRKQMAKKMWFVMILLVGCAAYLAGYKPF